MTKPLRILHIYKDYFPVLGGIENHIRVLAEAQAAQGHHVTVLVASPRARTCIETINGVKVIKAARWASVASTPISPALFYWTARLEADVTHLHFPHPPGEVANWIIKPGRRTILSYHSDIVRQANLLRIYRPLLNRVLCQADAIIVGSPPMKNSPYLARHQVKLRLVPYGIPLARFLNAPSDATLGRVREQYIPDDAALPPATLLFVGRLRYYKGLETLLRALPSISARLLVVGVGPMAKEWQALATEIGVTNRVAWLNEVPDNDLPVLYHLADLFVLPASHPSEAFGLVQIEAMASGIPLVSTELGTGTSWVNQHGATGLVVPPRNPVALAKAVNSILSDPARRADMGGAARQRALAEFSQETMVARVEEVYRDALNA